VARREFAARNTWALRAAVLRTSLLGLFARVRIVVISYDNAALLAQCLDSVRDCTTHPNYEVLVVDNRSSSATATLLAARAAADARVRVVRNLHNAGFAEAANLGLRAAGDYEYAVLLNDDTVVTRGWLQRLLRHLADGRTGLVGPVTNFAGNEARIGVPYSGTAGAAQFAAQRAREFDGSAFEIPMLAMYCVAFRRALLQSVGALDEQFEVGMFEDDDFALRVRAAGLRVLCAEDVFVHHVGRASFGQLPATDYERVFSANRQRFERKWGRKWEPHCARA
jgi:GT2 family glycosyltransferase